MPNRDLNQQRCETHADLCRAFAKSAGDRKIRDHWLRLAKSWEETAAHFAADEATADKFPNEIDADVGYKANSP